MRKILFLDVDGTIVDYSTNIPASAVEAIQKARANGHLVYLCTGRSKAEIYPDLWAIGFDGMIGGNGSYVEHHDEVLMDQHLTLEDGTQIVDWLHERGLEFYLESNNGLFASEQFETKAVPAIVEYSARKGKPGAENLKVRDVFPDMIFDGELYRDDLNKVSFVLNSYQDYLDAVAEFPDLKVGTWGGAGQTALFGDIGVQDIDKSVAVDVVLKHLGASIEDTFAFGDANIDIPMLEYCGTGVAMGNGSDEIKAIADYITDDVEENGLYNAFKHYSLI